MISPKPGLLQVLSRHGGKGPAVPVPKELVLLSEGELPNWTGEFRKKRSPSDGGPRVRISFPPAESLVRTWLSAVVRKIAGQRLFASTALPVPLALAAQLLHACPDHRKIVSGAGSGHVSSIFLWVLIS